MDVVVSLQKTDTEITGAQRGIIGFAAFAFFITSAIILLFLLVVLAFLGSLELATAGTSAIDQASNEATAIEPAAYLSLIIKPFPAGWMARL